MYNPDTDLRILLATNLSIHFRKVVQQYRHRLYAFAYRLSGGSQQDAEDIVQEALVSAYVSLENYPPQRIYALQLQAWLYRITLNVYTHYKRGSRLQLVPLNLSDESSILEIEDCPDENPEAIFEHLENRQELEQLVAQLPERYRIVITCYYFEHLNYQEIAALLDQPLGTVKSSVSRGIRLLRTYITTIQNEGRSSSSWANKNIRTSSKRA